MKQGKRQVCLLGASFLGSPGAGSSGRAERALSGHGVDIGVRCPPSKARARWSSLLVMAAGLSSGRQAGCVNAALISLESKGRGTLAIHVSFCGPVGLRSHGKGGTDDSRDRRRRIHW
jgi:hypothetical protein